MHLTIGTPGGHTLLEIATPRVGVVPGPALTQMENHWQHNTVVDEHARLQCFHDANHTANHTFEHCQKSDTAIRIHELQKRISHTHNRKRECCAVMPLQAGWMCMIVCHWVSKSASTYWVCNPHCNHHSNCSCMCTLHHTPSVCMGRQRSEQQLHPVGTHRGPKEEIVCC
jgi:hypothetical protein